MKLQILIGLLSVCITFSTVVAYPQLQIQSDPVPFFPHLKKFSHKNFEITNRLTTSVTPSHYKIRITPIIEPENEEVHLSAPGRVIITVKCNSVTKSITLHSYDIEVDEDALSVKHAIAGTIIPVKGLDKNPDQQTITIQLDMDLTSDEEYLVEIHFVARVADDRLNGLYLSKYIDPTTSNINYHAATQFEAIDARKAFPCFDEPALKATFQITIGRSLAFHSLSNMNIDEDGVEDGLPPRFGYVWDIYHTTTHRMSTYLVALVVSDFTFVTSDSKTNVKVWGPEQLLEQDSGKFAADTSAKMLTFFDSYFGLSYDFPKMDQVAVSDFHYGAMENWGLNLYRPKFLLYTEGVSTQLNKWQISSVIAHEIAHQWIGNVVTMEWWSDLWLNEGLANYLQFVGTAAVTNEYEPWDRFGIDCSQSGLEYDGRADAVPVHVDNETHFVQVPFAGTYQKGSGIIRMMEGFLTEPTLTKGLKKYLKNLEYKNAIQDNLFDYLTQVGYEDDNLPRNLTIKQIMDTWTLQAGFPLIRVSRITDTVFYISQERFSNDANENPDAYTWHVPIPYITNTSPLDETALIPKFWISDDTLLISEKITPKPEWILLNPYAYGFYRVLYDSDLTTALKKQLDTDHLKVPTLSRGQLLDDYFKSAFGEYISIKTAMDLTGFLDKEKTLPVWVPALNNLKIVYNMVKDVDVLGEKFRLYMLSKVTPWFLSTGTQNSVTDTLLRTEILDWACALGNEICLTNATTLLDEWMNSESGEKSFGPDFEATIYCAAVFAGGKLYRDFMLKKYTDENVTPIQQSLFLNALACPNDASLLNEALNMAVNSDSPIRDEDSITLMGRVADNTVGRQVAFSYIKLNVEAILKSRVNVMGIQEVLTTLSKYFATPDRLDEVRQFLNENSKAFTPEFIKETVASIEENIKWFNVHRSGLQEFFK